MNESSGPSICILATIASSIKTFYKGQIESLQRAGFRVTVVCAPDDSLAAELPEGVAFVPVRFTRRFNPLISVAVFFQLLRLFRTEKYSVIQYSTPKASLLASAAAWLAGCRRRVYLLWGLYYTGQHGLMRAFFKLQEKIVCTLSTHILPIVHEMVDFAAAEGLARRDKCEVMANGSACGVDLERFCPDKWKNDARRVRKENGIPDNAVVIGTVARLTGDKGINELVAAFDRLSSERPELHLLMVGQEEEKDRPSDLTREIIQRNNRIHCVGKWLNPLPFFAAMDIFCLPTYREGFGEVNLEAQAMGLPVVSTDVIGPRESVENGVTGFLVPPKSADAVYDALKKLVQNPVLCKAMGQKGRERAIRKFDRNDFINVMVQHRLKLVSPSRDA